MAMIRNVLALLVDIDVQGLYKLGNENGTMAKLFSRRQFMICKKALLNLEGVPAKKSLCQLANIQSLLSGQDYQRRKQNSSATTKCQCRASRILWNSKHHSSFSRSNM